MRKVTVTRFAIKKGEDQYLCEGFNSCYFGDLWDAILFEYRPTAVEYKGSHVVMVSHTIQELPYGSDKIDVDKGS